MSRIASSRLLALLGAGAMAAYASAALAQGLPGEPGPGAGAQAAPDELAEVVVTATKQADVISRVPLSIVAETQRSLDQQGIKTAQDLNRIVPSLVITPTGPTGVNLSIRGIRSAVAGGAATTGVYLDDTALQTRSLAGIANGGGAFLPPLFDLERVEVLKGPQGTLYGGSSEGGTIRFITPAPSVTRYSASAKAELNTVYKGSMGGEAGLAVGGPIVQDKLGFRASVYYRHIGGWVDHVDRNHAGAVLEGDTNWQEQKSAKVALLWKPTEQLSITPSVYWGYDRKEDADTVFLDIPQYTVPTRYYSAPAAGGTFTRLPGPAGANITAPGYTVGPYNYLTGAKYDTLANDLVGENYANQIQALPEKQPRVSTLFLPTLTVDYDLGRADFRSITSYYDDRGKGNSQITLQEPISATTTNQAGFFASDPGPIGASPFNPFVKSFSALYYYRNARSGISQEVRLASTADARPISWVIGGYYSSYHQHSFSYDREDLNDLYLGMFGVSADRRFGPTFAGRPFTGYQDVSDRESALKEKELAGFGELNLWLTQKLKLIGGVRFSKNSLDYFTRSAGLQNVPSQVTGNTTEHPITPKVGISYQATDDDLYYVTVAKGYRPGGVNAPITKPGRCDADLNNLGIDSTPATFDSDTVWSYEGGAKLKLFNNRAFLASSVYYIKWNKPQINFTLPLCVAAYTTNAGTAVSKGFDVQGDVRVFPGLTASFSLGYTNAAYPDAILGPVNANTGARATLVNAGDWQPGVPRWQGNLGVQYQFMAVNLPAYVRADYQYIGESKNTLGPGTSGYAPDAYWTPGQAFVNARLGVNYSGLDVSLFAENLFNQDAFSPAALSGRANCLASTGAACTSFSSYYYQFTGTRPRPRTVGVTATYRY